MAAASFVEGYLRRGVESGLEQKAIGSSSDAIGGYAVPEEIDEAIERPLDRQTILPMAAQILGSISAMLSEWLGPVRLEVDSDKLTELAEEPRPAVGAGRSGVVIERSGEAVAIGLRARAGRAVSAIAYPGEALLASLMAQAEGRGVDLVTLRALVEESSQSGARRALDALGLDDERARRDMDELRELLSAWRDAKRSARRALVAWIMRVALAMLLIGLAVKLRLTDLILQ